MAVRLRLGAITPTTPRERRTAHAQWNAQADPNRKELINDRMAFTYAQLGGVKGLKQLLAMIQQNRAHVRQVLRTLHGTQLNVQDVFVTRVAALEGFDKNLRGGNDFLRDRLKTLANDVIAASDDYLSAL